MDYQTLTDDQLISLLLTSEDRLSKAAEASRNIKNAVEWNIKKNDIILI